MLEQGELEQLRLAPATGSRSLLIAGQPFVMEFDEPTLELGAGVNNFYPGVTFVNAVKVLTQGTGNATPNCISISITAGSNTITINVPSGFQDSFYYNLHNNRILPGNGSFNIAIFSDINGQGLIFSITLSRGTSQIWGRYGKCEAH
jgi:hypothetical protein